MAGIDPNKKFEELMQKAIAIIVEEITNALKYLGESSVSRVRKRSGDESWFDQTGNLRSSIGYAIFEHGSEVIRSAFPVVKDGVKGSEEGNRYITELARQYSSTFALVVVAAMNYADIVEDMQNKDVLASTELWARDKIDLYIKQAVQKAERRINKL